jgi:hypothetical protein
VASGSLQSLGDDTADTVATVHSNRSASRRLAVSAPPPPPPAAVEGGTGGTPTHVSGGGGGGGGSFATSGEAATLVSARSDADVTDTQQGGRVDLTAGGGTGSPLAHGVAAQTAGPLLPGSALTTSVSGAAGLDTARPEGKRERVIVDTGGAPDAASSSASGATPTNTSALAQLAAHTPEPRLPPSKTASSGGIAGTGLRGIDFLADLEFVKLVSAGGAGRVYLARARGSGKVFAVKMMLKTDLKDKNMYNRVMMEREIMTELSQQAVPFFVRLYCAFRTRDYLALVMEFVGRGGGPPPPPPGGGGGGGGRGLHGQCLRISRPPPPPPPHPL